ncbi:hypothetical protein VPH35_091789 [Triticum aestivum]
MAPTEGSSMADLPTVDGDQEEGSSISRRPMSWLPPRSPRDCGEPPPKSVVLDTLVYVDDCTNASTAEGVTSNGHAIYLTFWPAHPPLISYFTVHLPTLLQDGSATSLTLLPRLVRTDGDLALFRVMIGCSYIDPDHNNYIIYRAGINKLEVLPTHPTRLFADWSVALLSCPGDGRFLVANVRSTYDIGQYALDLFDSGSGTWSTRSMRTEPPHEDCYYGTPTKVIALGGHRGSVGWVDLWNGILICDLLRSGGGDDDVLRFIRLPVLLAPNKMTPGCLSCDRDVSVGSDGCIKYSEVWAHPTWLEPKKKWHIDLKLRASDIIVDEIHSELLPHHVKGQTLSRQHTGHPALSLHDDDVVYIMAKADHMDEDFKRSWGFRFMYLQSDLSSHLAATSENTDVSNLQTKSKRSSRRYILPSV